MTTIVPPVATTPIVGKNRWSVVFSILTSITALFVSLGNFVYVVRTFSVTQRPYLGVATVDFQIIGSPAKGLAWKFTIKNSGTKPARTHFEENVVTLTDAKGRVVPVPSSGPSFSVDANSLVMPGEGVNVVGRYVAGTSGVPMEDILSGAARLDFAIGLGYTGESAFGERNYSYHVKGMMNAITGMQPYFAQTQVEGN